MDPLDTPLDIRDVAKRTGLTSRALRFYEARGLLSPLRTYSGRRLYGRGELERIQQILALKRAGLSLAQIGNCARQHGPRCYCRRAAESHRGAQGRARPS